MEALSLADRQPAPHHFDRRYAAIVRAWASCSENEPYGSGNECGAGPVQPPQGYDLVFLFIAQDIAHMRRVTSLRLNQCPEHGLYMAGFQVIIYGRFWVSTEDLLHELCARGPYLGRRY